MNKFKITYSNGQKTKTHEFLVDSTLGDDTDLLEILFMVKYKKHHNALERQGYNFEKVESVPMDDDKIFLIEWWEYMPS